MNVMLTCAGRRNYLINFFKEALGRRGKVFAADASADAAALQEADRAFVVPRLDHPEYFNVILDVCRQNRVKLLIPLIDLELPLLAEKREWFRREGIIPVVSSSGVVDICFDKWATIGFLRDCGLNTPRTYLSLEDAECALSKGELNFPLVVKPRWGSASVGMEFPEDREELETAYKLVNRKIMRTILADASSRDRDRCILIQEKLRGKEYGLDIVNDLDGNYVCTFVKRKISMNAGETDRAITVADYSLEGLGKMIGEKLGHVGNLDCDVMITDAGCYVLEFNPRFGGGYPFSHIAGANIPAALVAWAMGKKPERQCFNIKYDVQAAKCDRLVTKKKDKIAFVASVYSHLEAFHIPYMIRLQDKGYEVHAYSQGVHGKEAVEKAGVICHDIPFERSPFRRGNLTALRELTSSFKSEEFQTVHLHTPVASILGRIAAKAAGIPSVIYTAHGFHFYKGAPLSYWLLYYPVERLMARWTDYLITINQEDYRRAETFPVRKQVVYVPGVGINCDEYLVPDEITAKLKLRSQLGLTDDDFVILCVAELIPRKNQIQLIKAVEYMAAHHQPVHCLLVGTGCNEADLKNYVAKQGLGHCIRFMGFRRDVRELMAASDVVALLSKHEGLPRVIMEAMAAGKPIVATGIRGNSDLVKDGETGYLVPVNDVKFTVDSFSKLLNNPERRLAMGKKGRESVAEYTIENVLPQMEKTYDEATKAQIIKP